MCTKKFFVWFLSALLILCAVPMGVFASAIEEGSEQEDVKLSASETESFSTVISPANQQQWILAGAEYIQSENCYVLTPDQQAWTVGAIWYNKPIDGDFTVEMDYYSGVEDRPLGGADGLVLAFYANNGFTLPSGGAIGFDGCHGFGVEIDTYNNGEHNDPDGNHIAIVKTSVSNHVAYAELSQCEDGAWHHLKVEVEDGECFVYVDGGLKLSHKVERTGYDWLGVTSATGTGTNLHAVKNITVSTDEKIYNDSLIKRHLDIQLTHLKSENVYDELIEYQITAKIKDKATSVAENVQATIDLPNELTLVDGSDGGVELGDIQPGSYKEITWTVRVPVGYKNKDSSYAIDVLLNGAVQLRQERPIRYGYDDSMAIAIFTTEKSFNIRTNSSIYLGFGLMERGVLNGNWEKMSISVSDPSVIALSEYEETDYGYSIELIGKKPGSTTITVTDTKSGVNTTCIINVYDTYAQSYIYDINKINASNDGLSTNIYDLNGLYVSDYECTKNDDGYLVRMNVYNSKYHMGAVDVYDSENNWVSSYPIEKFTDISSIVDAGIRAYYLVTQWNTDKWLTYKQDTFSRCTSFMEAPIFVPEGGYMVVPNNCKESPGVFLYNSVELLINGLASFFDIVPKVTSINVKTFISDLQNKIFSIPSLKQAFLDSFKKTACDLVIVGVKELSVAEMGKLCANMVNVFEQSMSISNINWKDFAKTALSISEDAFIQVFGPAGTLLEGWFTIVKMTNTYFQIKTMVNSVDNTYVTVHSAIDDGYVNPYGVLVSTDGNIDTEAVLQVFKVSSSDTLEVVLGSDDTLETYELYNISFVKNDKNVQPNGKVRVYVPIPDDMVGDTSKIYRQESDGSWTILDAHVDGGYLVFETEHFSLYAIAGSTAQLVINELPIKTEYKVGEAVNMEGALVELNGKALNSGYICVPAVVSKPGKQEIRVVYGSASASFEVNVESPNGSDDNDKRGGSVKGEDTPWVIVSLCAAFGVAALVAVVVLVVIKKKKATDIDETKL